LWDNHADSPSVGKPYWFNPSLHPPDSRIIPLGHAIARGLENFVGRADGPMSFRLIFQPAVAILLALWAGMRDAREGRPPFLWAILSDQSCRRELMRQGWKDVGNVFIVALVLDSIYQVIVHSSIYALELLLTATLLALVPYMIVRPERQAD
jgi:hypothetical protein